MYDLSYFNLGFRSDSVSNLLNSLRSDDMPNVEILNDAFGIIESCLEVKENHSLVQSFAIKKGYEITTLLPILAELYTKKSVDTIIADLKKIYTTVNKIQKDRNSATDSEYEHAISFFSGLADICLSNSVHQINSEKLALA